MASVVTLSSRSSMATGSGAAGTRATVSCHGLVNLGFALGSTEALMPSLTARVAAAPRIRTSSSPAPATRIKKHRAFTATTQKSCRTGFSRSSLLWSSPHHTPSWPSLLLAESQGARCRHLRSPPSRPPRSQGAQRSRLLHCQGANEAAVSKPLASLSQDRQNLTATGLAPGVSTMSTMKKTGGEVREGSSTYLETEKKRKRKKADDRTTLLLSTSPPSDREDLAVTVTLPKKKSKRRKDDVATVSSPSRPPLADREDLSVTKPLLGVSTIMSTMKKTRGEVREGSSTYLETEKKRKRKKG